MTLGILRIGALGLAIFALTACSPEHEKPLSSSSPASAAMAQAGQPQKPRVPAGDAEVFEAARLIVSQHSDIKFEGDLDLFASREKGAVAGHVARLVPDAENDYHWDRAKGLPPDGLKAVRAISSPLGRFVLLKSKGSIGEMRFVVSVDLPQFMSDWDNSEIFPSWREDQRLAASGFLALLALEAPLQQSPGLSSDAQRLQAVQWLANAEQSNIKRIEKARAESKAAQLKSEEIDAELKLPIRMSGTVLKFPAGELFSKLSESYGLGVEQCRDYEGAFRCVMRLTAKNAPIVVDGANSPCLIGEESMLSFKNGRLESVNCSIDGPTAALIETAMVGKFGPSKTSIKGFDRVTMTKKDWNGGSMSIGMLIARGINMQSQPVNSVTLFLSNNQATRPASSPGQDRN